MAAKHLDYLSIPQARRRATAAQTLLRLKESLGNPTLTQGQLTALTTKIEQVNKWAAGKLPATTHTIEISEDVEVGETV